MPLDSNFYKSVEPLLVPGMGTENVGPLLYSLVRMLRPRTLLEVGLGYTTPFLVQAIQDNIDAFERDKQGLSTPDESPALAGILMAQYFDADYRPLVYGIDDCSSEGTSAPRVMETLESLGLADRLELHNGDFRGYSRNLGADALPLDFVWLDCGGADEYIDFLEEYWSLIREHHGFLALHYTYWPFPERPGNWDRKRMVVSPLLNEIRKQQLLAGVQSTFEVLSLLEPHKYHQGSMTLIRKLPPEDACRQSGLQEELEALYGSKPKPLIKL